MFLTIIIFRKKNKTPAASLEKLNHWPIMSINPLSLIWLKKDAVSIGRRTRDKSQD
jgi:hypothetical protein